MKQYRKKSEMFAEMIKLFENGLSDEQIAEKMSYTVGTVKQYRTIAGLSRQPRYTKAQHAEMRAMHRNGYSIREIADYFECYPNTVARWVNKDE